jgi:phytoene desaturase
MATAIRLAKQGFRVTVFEKNAYPGGKLSEITHGKYRFDKGPSLLTMPELIDELTILSGYKTSFSYLRLKTITHYFFEDGTIVVAKDSAEELAKELKLKLNENEQAVISHLTKSKFYHTTIADLFLNQSLGKIKNFLNLKTLKAVLNSYRLNLFSTMHKENSKFFKNDKTTQIFNRYATYNGSSPYKAPALLNIIPHLEFGLGAYLPDKGMHQITEHLYNMALHCGVTFKFNENVEKIEIENKKTCGLVSNGVLHKSALVVSDADIHLVYKKLLPQSYYPTKLLAQEKSSSAYVFYWGVKKDFPELDLHNILFCENYKEEFRHLFEENKPYTDPTVYINITSKLCKADAPSGCENWFVMVNVPHNKSGNSIAYACDLRKNVIAKINRVLKTDIEPLIEAESILDPLGIEIQTSSFGGSLYGNASNNKFSAFLRHANYNSKLKGLYFVGGSVHPGGGIPLCLLSSKIVSNLIKDKKLVGHS